MPISSWFVLGVILGGQFQVPCVIRGMVGTLTGVSTAVVLAGGVESIGPFGTK